MGVGHLDVLLGHPRKGSVVLLTSAVSERSVLRTQVAISAIIMTFIMAIFVAIINVIIIIRSMSTIRIIVVITIAIIIC